MNIKLLGDYYVWYCDWCDTRNLTLQQKFAVGVVSCGACHKHFDTTAREGEHFALCGGF